MKIHEKPIIDQLRLHKPNETAGVCSRAIMEIKRLTALLADAERERDEAKADHDEWRRQAAESDERENRKLCDALAKVVDLTAELAAATERAERAADAEREIVAWLRRQADSGEKYLDDNGLDRNMHPSTVSAISTMRTLASSIELGIYKGGGDG